jgi:bidirectional [NiFe] hydrogenase diaphorase subunit
MLANTLKPPSDDKRWRLVTAAMRRHGQNPSALIETLHAVQQAFGYLDTTAMQFVAQSLNVPLSKVYGVATFYNFFNLKPQGDHTCVVCMGTACYIKGGPARVEQIQQVARVKPGQTSKNNEVSLLVARCLGACGLAPAVVFDEEVAGKISPADAAERVKGWLQS